MEIDNSQANSTHRDPSHQIPKRTKQHRDPSHGTSKTKRNRVPKKTLAQFYTRKRRPQSPLQSPLNRVQKLGAGRGTRVRVWVPWQSGCSCCGVGGAAELVEAEGGGRVTAARRSRSGSGAQGRGVGSRQARRVAAAQGRVDARGMRRVG